MTDMSTEDMKASVAQVWRATYEESGLSIPGQRNNLRDFIFKHII